MIGSSSLAAREWSRLEAAARPLSLLFNMEAKSVITFPSGEMNLPGPGFYEMLGGVPIAMPAKVGLESSEYTDVGW